jgi:hypothetical protein
MARRRRWQISFPNIAQDTRSCQLSYLGASEVVTGVRDGAQKAGDEARYPTVGSPPPVLGVNRCGALWLA